MISLDFEFVDAKVKYNVIQIVTRHLTAGFRAI